MRRATRRFGLQSRLFASEPWNVIEHAVHSDCPAAQRDLALAFLEQARDFFTAGEVGRVHASKPLLIYYSLLSANMGNHHHGLSTDLSAGAGPTGVKITAFQTGSTINLFDMLLTALTGSGLSSRTVYDLDRLLPQVLLGHRLWCEAADASERFIEVRGLQFRESKNRKEVWARFDIQRSEYLRLDYTQKKMIAGARLSQLWESVSPSTPNAATLRFQTNFVIPYTHRPSDVVNSVAAKVKYSLWRSITIMPPFRKYYIYVADAADLLLPQICSIYLIFFYLGSITRYRPNHFDELISGSYGAFLREFIENQPNQWLYMLASEFAEQEVTRAAVV
jgi:hypothetical protein